MKSKGNVYQALDVRNGELEFFSSDKGLLELFINRCPNAKVTVLRSKLWRKLCDDFEFNNGYIDDFQYYLMDEQASVAENAYLDGI